MTLLITVFAAIASTIVWYACPKRAEMRLGTLVLMFWGASLMWLVDAVFEYAELGAEYFSPAAADMQNDAFLGLCAVALGLVIWLGILLFTDPKGVIKNTLAGRKK